MNKIAIRVDGNRHIGLGHIFRCIYFADTIKTQGFSPCFYMLESSLSPEIKSFLDQRNLPYHIVSKTGAPWEEDFTGFEREARTCDWVLVDLIKPDPDDDDLNLNPEFKPQPVDERLKKLSEIGPRVIALSDQYDKMALKADIIINSCPNQRHEWYTPSEASVYLLGPEYYILGPSFKKFINTPKKFNRPEPEIVVFCGGNDHRGFTPVIIDALKPYMDKINIQIIIGAATPNGDLISNQLNKEGITTHFCLPDISPVLFDADFVISTSGNTLFDLAALGVPSAAVSTRRRQGVTADFFQDAGSCLHLGYDPPKLESGLSSIIHSIILNPAKLAEMSRQGRQTVDGLGVDRIIDVIKAKSESGKMLQI